MIKKPKEIPEQKRTFSLFSMFGKFFATIRTGSKRFSNSIKNFFNFRTPPKITYKKAFIIPLPTITINDKSKNAAFSCAGRFLCETYLDAKIPNPLYHFWKTLQLGKNFDDFKKIIRNSSPNEIEALFGPNLRKYLITSLEKNEASLTSYVIRQWQETFKAIDFTQEFKSDFAKLTNLDKVLKSESNKKMRDIFGDRIKDLKETLEKKLGEKIEEVFNQQKNLFSDNELRKKITEIILNIIKNAKSAENIGKEIQEKIGKFFQSPENINSSVKNYINNLKEGKFTADAKDLSVLCYNLGIPLIINEQEILAKSKSNEKQMVVTAKEKYALVMPKNYRPIIKEKAAPKIQKPQFKTQILQKKTAPTRTPSELPKTTSALTVKPQTLQRKKAPTRKPPEPPKQPPAIPSKNLRRVSSKSQLPIEEKSIIQTTTIFKEYVEKVFSDRLKGSVARSSFKLEAPKIDGEQITMQTTITPPVLAETLHGELINKLLPISNVKVEVEKVSPTERRLKITTNKLELEKTVHQIQEKIPKKQLPAPERPKTPHRLHWSKPTPPAPKNFNPDSSGK